MVGIIVGGVIFFSCFPNKEERQDYLVEIPIDIPSGALERVDFKSMRNTPTVKITFDLFQQKMVGEIGKVLYCIVDEHEQGRSYWSVYYYGFPTTFCGAVYQAQIPWDYPLSPNDEKTFFRKSYISAGDLKMPDRLEIKLSFDEFRSLLGVLLVSILGGGICGYVSFGLVSFLFFVGTYLCREVKK